MLSKIIICDMCEGTGKRTMSEITDYHHHECIEWEEPCANCKGTGRMVQEISERRLTKEELSLVKKPK